MHGMHPETRATEGVEILNTREAADIYFLYNLVISLYY